MATAGITVTDSLELLHHTVTEQPCGTSQSVLFDPEQVSKHHVMEPLQHALFGVVYSIAKHRMVFDVSEHIVD